MTYQEYAKLGFKRTEWNDSVNMNQYGYGGFFLVKQIIKNVSIEVDWLSLDEPKLYIMKNENTIILDLTFEQVKQMINGKVKLPEAC